MLIRKYRFALLALLLGLTLVCCPGKYETAAAPLKSDCMECRHVRSAKALQPGQAVRDLLNTRQWLVRC